MTDDLRPIHVESFWGAIAAFFLHQIFGFVIFQGIVYQLFVFPLLLIWSGLWLLLFLIFQSETLRKIRRFFAENQFRNAFSSLKTPDDLAKFLATVIFAGIWVLFLIGFYPFPTYPLSPWLAGVFVVVSWIVSIWFGKNNPENESRVNHGIGALVTGLIVGGMFLIAGYASGGFFYLIGLVGLGVIVLLLTPLLVSDQIK